MIFVVFKYFTPKRFIGFTLFPFVFLSQKEYKKDLVLVNHEKIHIRQQIEMLVLPFLLWYFFEFFIRWIVLKDKNRAYRNISFEREAYSNEKDLDYLKKRPFWAFKKYL